MDTPRATLRETTSSTTSRSTGDEHGDFLGSLLLGNHFNLYNAADVSVPAAVSVFPGENYQAPRSWMERAYHKLIYYKKVEKAGTMRPGNSRKSSQKRFARGFDHCANSGYLSPRRSHGFAHNAVAWIMPHGPRWATGVVGRLRMRLFGIIRGPPGRRVAWSSGRKRPGLVVRQSDAGERLFLETEVGMHIDLGGFNRFVSEPKCDHGLIDAVMEQLHGGLCRRTCGLTRLSFREGHDREADSGVPADDVLQRIAA